MEDDVLYLDDVFGNQGADVVDEVDATFTHDGGVRVSAPTVIGTE